MSSELERSNRGLARPAWLPMTLLAGAGIAAGFYLAGPAAGPQTGPQSLKNMVATTPSKASIKSAPPAELIAGEAPEAEASAAVAARLPAPKLHRFPLTAADVKDTQGAPDIAVAGDGRVHLVWASITGETEQTAFVSSSAAGLAGFSSPQAVVRSPIAFRSQGNGKKGYAIRMAPHIAALGNVVHLTWSETVPDGSTVQMVLVKSLDNCATFSEPLCVHAHPQARPTFTALAIGSEGQLACSWLDGRAMNQHPYASMRLAGRSQFLPEFKLPGGENDKGVCPCCPTAATFAPDGTLFVAFRNLVDGYRDLAIVRLSRGADQFEGPFAITPPAWKFDGCPHDGPSLVVTNGHLHATWMDAHSGVQRAYYGRASLDDMKFQVQALHAMGPGAQGNVKMCADARGGVHAVWEESLENEPAADVAGGHQHGPPAIGSGRGIRYAFAPVGADAAAADAFEGVRFVHPVAATYQTRPAIAVSAEGQIYVSWCELSQDGKSIVVTSVAGDDGRQLTQEVSR